jgi:deoxyxylulose-5-phosphate synthase
VGVPDRFVMHGTVAELYAECGMDAESIAKILAQ